MLKKLADIAQIATGVYEKGNPSGDTLYLQAKHFDERGDYRLDDLVNPEISMSSKLERHLLMEGDVLLTAKGDNNKACLYQTNIGQAVASSTFFVVRVVEHGIAPEYLQWYLNTPYMQSQLSGLAKGTHIRSISKKLLMGVVVQIPLMKTQKQILEVQNLWNKERALTLELLEEKETLYQSMLLNLTKSKIKK